MRLNIVLTMLHLLLLCTCSNEICLGLTYISFKDSMHRIFMYTITAIRSELGSSCLRRIAPCYKTDSYIPMYFLLSFASERQKVSVSIGSTRLVDYPVSHTRSVCMSVAYFAVCERCIAVIPIWGVIVAKLGFWFQVEPHAAELLSRTDGKQCCRRRGTR